MKWIKIKDRLPKNPGRYLFSRDGYEFIADAYTEDGSLYVRSKVSYYGEGTWYEYRLDTYISHWAELKPPKTKGD